MTMMLTTRIRRMYTVVVGGAELRPSRRVFVRRKGSEIRIIYILSNVDHHHHRPQENAPVLDSGVKSRPTYTYTYPPVKSPGPSIHIYSSYYLRLVILFVFCLLYWLLMTLELLISFQQIISIPSAIREIIAHSFYSAQGRHVRQIDRQMRCPLNPIPICCCVGIMDGSMDTTQERWFAYYIYLNVSWMDEEDYFLCFQCVFNNGHYQLINIEYRFLPGATTGKVRMGKRN